MAHTSVFASSLLRALGAAGEASDMGVHLHDTMCQLACAEEKEPQHRRALSLAQP